MSSTISELNEYTHLSGKTLNEAILEFAPPELINEFQNPPKISGNGAGQGFAALLQELSAATLEYQSNKIHRAKSISALQNNILDLIKKGDLIAFGFKEPRDIQDNSIKIPTDLFSSGEINWENSELKYKGMEFSGIRLFQNVNPVINLKAEKSEIQEIKNSVLSDLDPDSFIDEKAAAKFLGISPRTLQGLRVKGGGPEFSKIGKKTVRYKIVNLINWGDRNKKFNTI